MRNLYKYYYSSILIHSIILSFLIRLSGTIIERSPIDIAPVIAIIIQFHGIVHGKIEIPLI